MDELTSKAATAGANMNIERLLATRLQSTVKGLPDLTDRDIALGDISKQGWNLLAGDLPIPVATINLDRMKANSRWMRSFTERHGVRICPHGKTTMSPQLFKLQLDEGAWGISVASTQQMRVCTQFGIDRVLMANQLVGDGEMKSAFRAINETPNFDFYCLVDSAENVRALHRAAQSYPLRRPLQVLLEGGVLGGRTGCRGFDEAMALATLIHQCEPHLALCGIEGFEGVIDYPDHLRSESAVGTFADYLVALFEEASARSLFHRSKPVLSIGGSVYFDLVALNPRVQAIRDRCDIVLRSGCYLTHDSGMLTANFKRVRARTAEVAASAETPQPALTVWARIQSMAEPGLAILNVGKRDISYDVDLPTAQLWFRASAHTAPLPVAEPIVTTQINDQHTFLTVSPQSELRVGDMIGLGVSHPCTTFDKWKLLYIIDDRYDVVEGLLTFF